MKNEFMKRAIELSIESVNKGGGPFGSVITKDNKIEINITSISNIYFLNSFLALSKSLSIISLTKSLNEYFGLKLSSL